jgi:hypothetical protein
MSTFFCKELTELGIKFEEVSEGILSIDNFISKEDIDSLFDVINSTTEDQWGQIYLNNLKAFAKLKHGRDDIDNLVAEGKLQITKNWADKNLAISDHPVTKKIDDKIVEIIQMADPNLIVNGTNILQRMYSGVQLYAHTDQDTDPSIQYAAILYLNDDYIGGELFFDKINVTLKPKPGTLVIFPGSEEFHHGVNFVKDGPMRYVVVGFIKTKDFYENNKY